VAAKFVKCPKSYYTEQFEKYGYIRDKYDTTYNTPTPYDPSLISAHKTCITHTLTLYLALQGHAVRVGMGIARGEFCLFMDADGATRFSDVEKLEQDLGK